MRGLYNQAQGDEKRTQTAAFAERLSDNQISEGDVVAVLTAMFNDKSRWGQIDTYCKTLKAKGYSQARIESILSRATFRM